MFHLYGKIRNNFLSFYYIRSLGKTIIIITLQNIVIRMYSFKFKKQSIQFHIAVVDEQDIFRQGMRRGILHLDKNINGDENVGGQVGMP